MRKLLCYTRKPIDEFYYDPRLAYSMHLALEINGKVQALNHNSGVLFPLATENANGSLNPKCLKHPYIFNMNNDTFGVIAVRTDGEGNEDCESKGCVIVFESKDLLEYKELGLIKLSDEYIEQAVCEYDNASERYIIKYTCDGEAWQEAAIDALEALNNGLDSVGAKTDAPKFELPETDIEGAVPECLIDITDEVAMRLQLKLTVPMHVATEFPVSITVGSKEELLEAKAVACYSDGTKADKRIDWKLDNIDWNVKGEYEIEGRLHQDHFEFPVGFNRADPCIGKWNGKYYFIATNDADSNHTLYVREADTIPELVNAEEKLILDSDTYPYVKNLLWAPEFHIVDGKMYIFLALTSGEFFCEESHVMELKEGGNPSNKEDWSEPRRVVKADGSNICEEGKVITLDMTCFEWQGEYYAVWSQREFLPEDLGAWLYIAKVNKKEPWKLASEPVVLSKPDYGWANNHTFVDEGPFTIVQEDRLILTYSSAAVDTSYVVGMLTIEKGKDLLIRDDWKKSNYPILTSRSVEGEFGTGHNAYVIDEYGDMWNTYHARPGIEGVRSSGIRRVHFDIDGLPRLDLVEEMDVNPEHNKVKTRLILE